MNETVALFWIQRFIVTVIGYWFAGLGILFVIRTFRRLTHI